MTPTSEQLWTAIHALATDESCEGIPQPTIDRLVVMGFVEVDAGEPKLTAKGEQAFTVMESGDGEVPEIGRRIMKRDDKRQHLIRLLADIDQQIAELERVAATPEDVDELIEASEHLADMRDTLQRVEALLRKVNEP